MNDVKTGPSTQDLINKQILDKLGGRPQHFRKLDVIPVGKDKFRANLWVSQPGGETGFMEVNRIVKSVFVTVDGMGIVSF